MSDAIDSSSKASSFRTEESKLAHLPNGEDSKAEKLGAKTPGDPSREAYEKAQQIFQAELGKYWAGVDKAKQAHQKVTQFPPFYKGPPKPPNYDPPRAPSTLPSVDDMLRSWKSFGPIAVGKKDLPALQSLKVETDNSSSRGQAASSELLKLHDEPAESEFKRAYAREAILVGAKYGLNKADTQNIVQNIYAFEDGGRGTADLLSGVPLGLTVPDAPGTELNKEKRRAIHPLSTAMGYNQMLMATSLHFIDGSKAVNDRLSELAKSEPARATEITEKSRVLNDAQNVVHQELLEFAKADPGKYLDASGKPNYALYTDFARSSVETSSGLTGRQVASALQSLNLDRDIGPVLQAQQLNEIIEQGLQPDFKTALQNKSSDDLAAARAFDTLPELTKTAAIEELLERVAPVPVATTAAADASAAPSPSAIPVALSSTAAAARSHTARETLEQALIAYSKNDRTPLTAASLGQEAYDLLNNKIVGFKKYGDMTGPLSPGARALVDQLGFAQMNGPSVEGYLPAAVELANLAGATNADAMLKPENSAYPTVNFFDRGGYQANGIANGRTADELVKAIYRNMHGKNGAPENYGIAEMVKAFDSQ
jgi:hypothetical protein